ncbi:MAG: NAD(P)/FAD-dependent oxidoreductase [Firmicutes bacterium]|jgi:predicted Rossmann fold flavoprotein|nr:NAD(P)/FAD-dependent oxidoreductase [Bacillota bacterium]
MHVVVIGGGPAGMMAAGQAALAGADVTLCEKNQRLGKKLAITGKGRGNVTNAAEIKELIQQYPGNGSFLYGPLYRFTNDDLRQFLLDLGVPTVVERGGRVFPQSQKAQDVVEALSRWLRKVGVKVLLGKQVTRLLVTERGMIEGVICAGEKLAADAVVLATGGASYPATGSTGDGYRLAQEVGHTIVTPRPALVPLETKESWVRELTGVALKNVTATLTVEGRVVAEEFGEMLFTHYGVSGPIILTISRAAVEALMKKKKPMLHLNLKPALTREQLDARLLRDFKKNIRKQFKNSLNDLLPQRLIETIIMLSGISPDLPVHQISKDQREALLTTLTDLRLQIKSPRSLREAIVTAGGVAVKEIHPTNMASKLVGGLYFAGEVIDIDGNTGGYNLQAAFSTGFVAGLSAALQA